MWFEKVGAYKRRNNLSTFGYQLWLMDKSWFMGMGVYRRMLNLYWTLITFKKNMPLELLQLINTFSNMTGFKINTHKNISSLPIYK